MQFSVLIVEDNPAQVEGFSKELTRNNWIVQTASEVGDAVSALRSANNIDIILLDLVLIKKDGSVEEGTSFLKKSKEEGLFLPPVVILSAYLDAKKVETCLNLGVRAIIPKPISVSSLPMLLETLCRGLNVAPLTVGDDKDRPTEAHLLLHGDQRMLVYSPDRPTDLPIGATIVENTELKMCREIKEREEALNNYIKERVQKPFLIENVKMIDRRSPNTTLNRQFNNFNLSVLRDEPLLIVARRWNSWYPSFFEVDGGSFVILGAAALEGTLYGVLIDPGFKALKVLNKLGIPVTSLNTCIITHNHPDHVGGFFEYAAARHASTNSTVAYCSQSVASMLGTYASSLHIEPFDRTSVEVIPSYPLKNGHESMRLVATPILTSHHTVGHVEGTRGILLSIEKPGLVGHYDCQATTLLLGDTEYQSERGHVNAIVFDGIRASFSRSNLKVVVLHIGCCQHKDKPGKHLYLTGLIDILRDIEQYRQTNGLRPPTPKLLVLVSEWGLEHATHEQILSAIPPGMPQDIANAFDSESRVIKTIDIIKDAHRFETIDLLPADEGLVVGLNSGRVYLNGALIQPDKIKCRANSKGIEYFV